VTEKLIKMTPGNSSDYWIEWQPTSVWGQPPPPLPPTDPGDGPPEWTT
jgi:hypothetical protein